VTAPQLVLGYVHGGTVRAEFCNSLADLIAAGATPVETVLAKESGPNISTARNQVCAEFLTRRSPWLLMCDTDMTFTPADVAALAAAADPVTRPVLGALCYSLEHGKPAPTMYELAGDEGRMAFTRVTSWPEGECVRVTATGAAFLLVHRGVLERVRDSSRDAAAPWFRETPVGPMALMGEDMTFCLRCAAADIPVHVHTGVRAGHMKTVNI